MLIDGEQNSAVQESNILSIHSIRQWRLNASLFEHEHELWLIEIHTFSHQKKDDKASTKLGEDLHCKTLSKTETLPRQDPFMWQKTNKQESKKELNKKFFLINHNISVLQTC